MVAVIIELLKDLDDESEGGDTASIYLNTMAFIGVLLFSAAVDFHFTQVVSYYAKALMRQIKKEKSDKKHSEKRARAE